MCRALALHDDYDGTERRRLVRRSRHAGGGIEEPLFDVLGP